MRKAIIFFVISIFTLIIVSCDSDGKDSLVSQFTSTTATPSVSTTTTSTTSTTSTSGSVSVNPTLYGLITDNYGIPISGVTIDMQSLNNSALKYQSQSKSDTKETTLSTTSGNLPYNFNINSVVSDIYSVTLSKAGYMEKEFMLNVENSNLHFSAEIYNNLSTNLGVISAHYNEETDLPSANIVQITLNRYLTQDNIEVGSTPPLAMISSQSKIVESHFKFENLPQTEEWTKVILHPDGTREEFQMATHYRIRLMITSVSTGNQESITSDDIDVIAAETTLVEIFDTTSNSVANMPVLVSPRNSCEVSTSVPVFSWEPVSGAVEYEINVYKDSDRSNTFDVTADEMVWNGFGQGESSILYSQTNRQYPMINSTLGINDGSVPALEADERYFWTVRAINGVSELPFTDPVFTFIKRAELGPVAISPSANSYISTLMPMFCWAGVPDTKTYVLEIGTSVEVNSSTVETVVWQGTLTEGDYIRHTGDTYSASYQVTDVSLAYGKTYYWRVANADWTNSPGWSDKNYFTTIDSPPVPNIAGVWTDYEVALTITLPGVAAANDLRDINFAGLEVYWAYSESGIVNVASMPLEHLQTVYWNGTDYPLVYDFGPVPTTEVAVFAVRAFSTTGVISGFSNREVSPAGR